MLGGKPYDFAIGLCVGLWAAGALAQPISEPILRSGLRAELIDVVQLPQSAASGPRARLNLLTSARDGSGRLFVNDMRGLLYILRDGVVGPAPFLNLAVLLGSTLDTGSLQTGLSSFAFHPDCGSPGSAGEGKLYTVHSEVPTAATPDFLSPSGSITHHDVLSEWSVDANDADAIDTASRRELLRIEQPSRDHNMGQIAFDPNRTPMDADYGLLYVAMGDSGNYNANQGGEIDPNRTAQDPSNPFGSILRIDPLGASTPSSPTNGRYGIPLGNPFIGNAQGSLEETWAFGFRNPHRFSWDLAGLGSMLISDIGQVSAEEINIGVAAGNYGWSEREGTFVLDHFDQGNPTPLPASDASFGYRYPAAQYDHDEGLAVVGGFVYRGSRVPQLVGQYLFGDVANGRIFHVPVAALLAVDPLTGSNRAQISELTLLVAGMETTLLQQTGGSRADLRFGSDDDGEIYILTKTDGRVRTLPEPSAANSLGIAVLTFAATSSAVRLRPARPGLRSRSSETTRGSWRARFRDRSLR